MYQSSAYGSSWNTSFVRQFLQRTRLLSERTYVTHSTQVGGLQPIFKFSSPYSPIKKWTQDTGVTIAYLPLTKVSSRLQCDPRRGSRDDPQAAGAGRLGRGLHRVFGRAVARGLGSDAHQPDCLADLQQEGG